MKLDSMRKQDFGRNETYDNKTEIRDEVPLSSSNTADTLRRIEQYAVVARMSVCADQE